MVIGNKGKDGSMAGSENPVKLTKSTLNMLRHLWDAENMTSHFNDVWKASGATYRGFCGVLDRAEKAGLVGASTVYASYALTFGGMTALRDHYTALYNARPCEAYGLDMEKFSHLPADKVAA